MKANRELKNSVFTALFDDRDKGRELYAALTGLECNPETPIIITTLRDVLSMNRINDLSFSMGKRFVVIVEHQSSLNHNMPLTMLLYIARVYEKIMGSRTLYRDTLVKIPKPECIVLYHGKEPTPDYWEESLPTAFTGGNGDNNPALDLRVKMYNINKGRELYAALTGLECDPETTVIITTLRDMLSMNRINDLSFSVGKRFVVIVEHQSSLNHNMPLTMLLYIARVYEKIMGRRTRYRDTLVKIPEPECIVVYHGKEPTPDYWEESLPTAFTGSNGENNPALDLRVKMYNINKGRNTELLKRSELLAGYAEFVAQVRECEGAMPLEQAVAEAIRRCARNGVLADFLNAHGSEVMNMLLDEWNLDETKEV